MKRNVILMGNKTYVISLPANWVKQHGITKGQELEVEPDMGKVTIHTDSSKQEKKAITMDFSEEKLIKAYQLGYDEIKIRGELNLEKMEHIINNKLPGLEIIRAEENYCVLKCIAEVDKKDFNSLLRKAFLLLSEMPPKNSFRKNSILRLLNLCKRCIFKKGHKSFSESLIVYNLLCDMEKTVKFGCKSPKAIKEIHDRFSKINYGELAEIKEGIKDWQMSQVLSLADSMQALVMVRS